MNKLWLDDVRIAPRGWIHAHSVEEAQKFFNSGIKFDEMSLDHDLSPPCPECKARNCYVDCSCHCHNPSGFDFLKWVHEQNLWPAKRPHVHSQNHEGHENMEAFIDRYGPYQKDAL